MNTWECLYCGRCHALWWDTVPPPPSCGMLQDETNTARTFAEPVTAPLTYDDLVALLERMRDEQPLPARRIKGKGVDCTWPTTRSGPV